jgi:hypothetical protein
VPVEIFQASRKKSGTGVALGLLVAVLLSGCATTRPSTSSSLPVADSEGAGPARREGTVIKATPGGEIIVRGVKLQNTSFDFPVTINSQVEKWVDYFLGRGRGHFQRYLERSELFIPFIQPLLKQNGLPEDLVYLAMIESGFNNHAKSHAKAVGPWQFISATGKRYGLMVNWWVDERRDTRKSTLAAVEYLRDLYGIFRSWELAAAAYNAGEAKVARAIQRYGSKDFWVLSRQRYLRSETRDYVPKIIAAALLAKNRTQFGFPAQNLDPHRGEVVAGDGELVKILKEGEAPASSSQRAEPETLAAILNEEDQRVAEVMDEDMGPRAIPVASLQSGNGGSGGGEQAQARPVPTPHVNKKGQLIGEEVVEIEVPSPADLLMIAQAAGLSYQTVKQLNPDVLRWCTPPMVSTFRVKLPALVKDRFLAAYNQPGFPRKVQFLAYKVRHGDSLSRIARHFGIKVDPMSDLNGVSPKMALRGGTRVLLPIPNDKSRNLASLEVRDPPERRRIRRKRSNTRSENKISLKRRQSARADAGADPWADHEG